MDCKGKIDIGRRKWQITKAPIGERVQLLRLDECMQAFDCHSLIRELDLGIQRSTMVERWIPNQVPKQIAKHVLGGKIEGNY